MSLSVIVETYIWTYSLFFDKAKRKILLIPASAYILDFVEQTCKDSGYSFLTITSFSSFPCMNIFCIFVVN